MNVIICSPFGQHVPGGMRTTWQRLKMWMLLKGDDSVSQTTSTASSHSPGSHYARKQAVTCLWTRLFVTGLGNITGGRSSSLWLFTHLSFPIEGLRAMERMGIGPIGLKDGRVHNHHVKCCCWLRASDPKLKQSGNSSAATRTYYPTSPTAINLFLNTTTWLWRWRSLTISAQSGSMQTLLIRIWRCGEVQECKRKQKPPGVCQWRASIRCCKASRQILMTKQEWIQISVWLAWRITHSMSATKNCRLNSSTVVKPMKGWWTVCKQDGQIQSQLGKIKRDVLWCVPSKRIISTQSFKFKTMVDLKETRSDKHADSCLH